MLWVGGTGRRGSREGGTRSRGAFSLAQPMQLPNALVNRHSCVLSHYHQDQRYQAATSSGQGGLPKHHCRRRLPPTLCRRLPPALEWQPHATTAYRAWLTRYKSARTDTARMQRGIDQYAGSCTVGLVYMCRPVIGRV